jgi:hypothetical protein
VTLVGQVTVVVLVAFATVNVPLPLLDWKPLSPPKLADTALAYDPALIPVRLTPLTVATPLAFVVPAPAGIPFSWKEMVLPETGEPLEVRVAVSVAVPPKVPLPLTALIVVGA